MPGPGMEQRHAAHATRHHNGADRVFVAQRVRAPFQVVLVAPRTDEHSHLVVIRLQEIDAAVALGVIALRIDEDPDVIRPENGDHGSNIHERPLGVVAQDGDFASRADAAQFIEVDRLLMGFEIHARDLLRARNQT